MLLAAACTVPASGCNGISSTEPGSRTNAFPTSPPVEPTTVPFSLTPSALLPVLPGSNPRYCIPVPWDQRTAPTRAGLSQLDPWPTTYRPAVSPSLRPVPHVCGHSAAGPRFTGRICSAPGRGLAVLPGLPLAATVAANASKTRPINKVIVVDIRFFRVVRVAIPRRNEPMRIGLIMEAPPSVCRCRQPRIQLESKLPGDLDRSFSSYNGRAKAWPMVRLAVPLRSR